MRFRLLSTIPRSAARCRMRRGASPGGWGPRGFFGPPTRGKPASSVARLRPQRPIIALTHIEWARRQMALEWGVTPILIKECGDVEELWNESVRAAREAGHIEAGDRVVITAGTQVNLPSSTKVIKVAVA